ncbi:MAG: hypothetical protein M0P26_04300 [Bacteroidales bacterium]|nr:hypothetical protein [Bacteroidales bacterium]
MNKKLFLFVFFALINLLLCVSGQNSKLQNAILLAGKNKSEMLRSCFEFIE